MTVIQCTHADCRQSYWVSPDFLGRDVRCRNCGRKFLVAASDQESLAGYSAETSLGLPASAAPSEHSSRTSSSSGKLPERIGRFQIRARVGHGAFGNVYRAYDPQLDREVAIKVPQAGLVATPQFVERFLREAKAAARLNHPYIVPVYDAGQDGEQSYIASAFIDGKPLSALVEEFSHDYRRIAEVIRRLAEALHYAHTQKIIHRDIKPHNVMLDAEDQPHLMDFGLAHLGNEAQKLTHDGALMGTPAYMSPEQAALKTDEITAASDQYSLGVVLYELLTGETPFAGAPSVVIYNILNSPLPPPRSLNPQIPRDLETICLKALTKEPSGRYLNCAILAFDLDRWLQDRAITARRMGPMERLLRWGRRNPLVAGLSAVVLVAVLAVFSSTVLTLQTERRSRDQANEHARQARVLTKAAEAARDDAQEASRLALLRANELMIREEELTAQKVRLEELLAELGVAKTQLSEVEQARDEKIATAEEEAAAARFQAAQAEADAAKAKGVLPINTYVKAVEEAGNELSKDRYAQAVDLLENTDADLRGIEWRLLHAAATKTLKVRYTKIGKIDHVYSSAPDRAGRWILAGDTLIRWEDGASTQVTLPAGFDLVAISGNYEFAILRRRNHNSRLFRAAISPALFSAKTSVVTKGLQLVDDFRHFSASSPAVVTDEGDFYFLHATRDLLFAERGRALGVTKGDDLFPRFKPISPETPYRSLGLYWRPDGGLCAILVQDQKSKRSQVVHFAEVSTEGVVKSSVSFAVPFRASDVADDYVDIAQRGWSPEEIFGLDRDVSSKYSVLHDDQTSRFLRIPRIEHLKLSTNITSGRRKITESTGTISSMTLFVNIAQPADKKVAAIEFPVDAHAPDIEEQMRKRLSENSQLIGANLINRESLHTVHVTNGDWDDNKKQYDEPIIILRQVDFPESKEQD